MEDRTEALDQRAARWINVSMFTLIAAFLILGSLWVFIANMGPAVAVIEGLPAKSQRALGAAASSFVALGGGLRLLWAGLRGLVARRRSRPD